jgi:hypothetical protein
MRALVVLVAAMMLQVQPCVSALEQAWNGMTLIQALERLRSEGLNVLYSSELVKPSMVVLAEPEGETPLEVLAALLAPHGLAVRVGAGGALMVVSAPSQAPATGAIRGRVLAEDTGQPLAGAGVRVDGREELVWSGRDGAFELTGLPAGSHRVEVRAAGYLAALLDAVEVAAGETSEQTVVLSPQPRFLQEVVVTPSQHGFLARQPESSQVLDRSEVQRVPHLADDVFRVIHRLPGVGAGDISAGFSLRGSSPEEVTILLDGLEIFEPFHMRDFASVVSVVDSEAVGSVNVLSGGYPADLGDSMGGVVEIAAQIPEQRVRSLGASLLFVRALAGGITDEGGNAWSVSFRRGFLDWVLDWTERIGESTGLQSSPEYSDLFGLWRHPVGESSLLEARLLGSRDRFHYEEDDHADDAIAHNSGVYVWATLLSTGQEGLGVRSMVSASRVNRKIAGVSDNWPESYSQTDDARDLDVVGLKQDWVLEPSRGHLLKWGADVRYAEARYENHSLYRNFDPLHTGGPPTVSEVNIETRPSGWQLALYSADRFRIATGVTGEVGVRWDRQTWAPGEDQISPRLNLVWELGGSGTIRAAWGRFAQAQGIYELQVEDGLETFFPAQWAVHRVVSYEYVWTSGLRLKLEGYHKSMTDLRPRFENLFEPIDILPAGEADRVRLDPDRARARGFELMLKSPTRSSWTWWLGYALSEAEDRIEWAWQPRSWDQRHALSFSVNWQAGKGWNLNLAGVAHSGWPTTPVYAHWEQLPDGSWTIVGELGQRNSARYPSYQRLDVRASRTVATSRGTFSFFFDVTNILNRDNVRSTGDIRYGAGPDGTIVVAIDHDMWAPILPSFGVSWVF